jgi:hypothetical protein
MRWLQFLYDLLKVVLNFFGLKKKDKEEIQHDFDEERVERMEEIDEEVENADDSELTDIAIGAGLVQRPCDSTASECTSRPKGSRFKSGKNIIE